MDIGSAWENKGYQEVTRPPEEGGARKVDNTLVTFLRYSNSEGDGVKDSQSDDT